MVSWLVRHGLRLGRRSGARAGLGGRRKSPGGTQKQTAGTARGLQEAEKRGTGGVRLEGNKGWRCWRPGLSGLSPRRLRLISDPRGRPPMIRTASSDFSTLDGAGLPDSMFDSLKPYSVRACAGTFRGCETAIPRFFRRPPSGNSPEDCRKVSKLPEGSAPP